MKEIPVSLILYFKYFSQYLKALASVESFKSNI